MTSHESHTSPHSMLWFVRDLPNIVSLLGLASAVVAVYFAILGVFPAAMIGLVWAVAFDWSDGRVARRMTGRTDDQRHFGAQLDSLIDVVSFGVVPAVLLLSVGGFRPWFLVGAIVVMMASVVRLGYFNVFGLADGSTYRGLALDNNAIVLVFLFAFERVIPAPVFAMVVYAVLVVLALLNVAPIRTPKFGDKWYYVMIAWALAMTGVFVWQLAVR